jgi:hypothetical protein
MENFHPSLRIIWDNARREKKTSQKAKCFHLLITKQNASTILAQTTKHVKKEQLTISHT